MKQLNGSLAFVALAASLIACNDGTPNATNANDTNQRNKTDTNNTTATTPSASATPTATGAPFSAQDSTFVMKAAAGGMTEIESAKVALANGESDRVKAYANMMITDHTKANDELKMIAGNHGMTVPAALPADKQQHIEAMKGMKGKAFDKHYIKMMVEDHNATVADFEKQANGGADADLKAFAAKTLPTLKAHTDSAKAMSRMKM